MSQINLHMETLFKKFSSNINSPFHLPVSHSLWKTVIKTYDEKANRICSNLSPLHSSKQDLRNWR